MNFHSFRHTHLMILLNSYADQQLPLDLFIHHYFRSHPSLGSKDRAFLAESIYGMIRWQRLLDYLLPNSSLEKKQELYQKWDLDALLRDESIPLSDRLSVPDFLFERLTMAYGEETAKEICLASNYPAPTTVRVNLTKISREELLARWQELYEVSPCLHSKAGIIFHKKLNFFTIPEFKQGFFEVQDEGSQLIAQLVQAQPGELVLDYCAGSGGKALAIAPLMHGFGQIFLHDLRKKALLEARKRLKRAGVQHAQLIYPDEEKKLRSMKKKFDWVLVDAPCSGTGTLRRNPDMKWKLSEEMIHRLVGQQRTIFERALSFLKPSGKIVYATCSILQEENQFQLDHFLKTYPLMLEEEPFHSLPKLGEMDGFFGATFRFT